MSALASMDDVKREFHRLPGIIFSQDAEFSLKDGHLSVKDHQFLVHPELKESLPGLCFEVKTTLISLLRKSSTQNFVKTFRLNR